MLGLVICVLSTFAQDDYDIITDRPDQTESSWTIPKHRLQIESGFQFQNTTIEKSSLDELTYQSTLLRYGLLDNFELRFGTSYSRSELTIDSNTLYSDESTTGFDPLNIGIKILIVEENGWIPRMALLGTMVIKNTGSKDFRIRNYASGFRFTGEYTLAEWVSFGFNLGMDMEGTVIEFIGYYSAVFGFSILPWMGAFVESYAYFPDGKEPDNRLDGGLTFPVRRNLQFDVSAGVGLSRISPDYFVAAGFAWRIPK